MTIDPKKRAALIEAINRASDAAELLHSELREVVHLSIEGGSKIEWQMLSQLAVNHNTLRGTLDLASRSD